MVLLQGGWNPLGLELLRRLKKRGTRTAQCGKNLFVMRQTVLHANVLCRGKCARPHRCICGCNKCLRKLTTSGCANLRVVDDAYIDWYRTKFIITPNKGMVMPVLHALQGHPESGALCEVHINGILKEEGF